MRFIAGHQRATKSKTQNDDDGTFAFVNFCGSLMVGDNESCVCQGKQKCLLSKLGICTAKFDVCSIPFVFSTLEHWTLNVKH